MAGGNFGGGDGTPENPYLVEDAADLNAVRNNLSAHYKQIADISLASYSNWNPIGNPFTGVYDGDGFKIEDLYVDMSGQMNVGMFGTSIGATFRDVHVHGQSFGQIFVGVLCGQANSTSFTRCSVQGSVNADGPNCGLLAGASLSGGQIINTFVIGTAIGNNTGLLIGALVAGDYNVSDCYARGEVSSATSSVSQGGLIGEIMGPESNNATIENCYCSVSFNGSGAYLGGLIGRVEETIGFQAARSYYDSTISGRSDTGKGDPRTTAQMTEPYDEQTTYVNWNFDEVWAISATINDGYPHFGLLGGDLVGVIQSQSDAQGDLSIIGNVSGTIAAVSEWFIDQGFTQVFVKHNGTYIPAKVYAKKNGHYTGEVLAYRKKDGVYQL